MIGKKETVPLRFKKRKLPSAKNNDFITPHEEMDLKCELIDRIVTARLEKHISQRDLSEQLGIAQSALARFESGRTNPTLSFLQKITEKLGLELDLVEV